MKRINIKTEAVNIIALTTLSLAVIGLIVYAWSLSYKLDKTAAAQAIEREAGFYELVSEAELVSADYMKLAKSGGDMTLLGTAQKNTARMLELTETVTLTDDTRRELFKFITTSGDFASSLQNKLLRGGQLSEDDSASLTALADVYSQLSDSLTEAWRGGYTADIELTGYAESAGIDSAAFNKESYPRLIYDGPFSETTMNRAPKGLPDYTVTEQRALKIASSFAGIPLSPSVHSDGALPCYNFTADTPDGAVSVSVTKQGGAVLSWFTDAASGEVSALPTPEKHSALLTRAQSWLSEMGFGRCTPGGYSYYGSGAVINMLPVHKNGAVLYTDMIKVRLSVESGKVTGADARSYVMNHVYRELEAPSVSEDEAVRALPAGLTPKSARMAVIPLDDGSEAYCYEYSCPSDDGDVLAYIGAYTGRLEDLLLIGHDGSSETAK